MGVLCFKNNVLLLLSITFHDIRNIYLYKVARACPTLRIGVGCVTHILICYVPSLRHIRILILNLHEVLLFDDT